MLAWAQSMTWKGQPPTIALNTSTYQKGMALTKQKMVSIEAKLERNPLLPKWDRVHPTSVNSLAGLPTLREEHSSTSPSPCYACPAAYSQKGRSAKRFSKSRGAGTPCLASPSPIFGRGGLLA